MAKRGRKRKHRFLSFLRLKPETLHTIFFLIFLLLAIVSIFSFLEIGPVPTQISLVFQNYFGFFAIMLPFLFLLISLFFVRARFPLKEPNIFLGFVIMFIALISLFKSGLAGSYLRNLLVNPLGNAISVIVYSSCLIAGFVILFDTNVVQLIKFIGKTYKTIKKYTIGEGVKLAKRREKLIPRMTLKPEPQSRQEPLIEKIDPNVLNIPPVFKTDNNKQLSANNHQIWQYPPISLFDNTKGAPANRGDVGKNAKTIEETLDSFGITAKVVEINDSPSVTQYALEVALGTKLAKIMSLSNDLAMALAAPGGQIRVEAPIPGRSLVGIEVPNHSLQVVPIRQILESDVMKQAKSKISVPLGLDVAGKPKIADIAKMPHVLIAGQTGSGKSVCVNSWITTLLFRASPEEVKLILVDPKRVELKCYDGIPHLLLPVIVEPEKVISALKWAVTEMERRYKQLTEAGVRNIEALNDKAGFVSMPYILIIIDELADIMMTSPTEVEESVCRIAQMARAVGIHLILATQRPSVNIITGLIKANIPARMAFAVTSMMDSRVILDTPGAEKLLGRGDMLYIPPELAKPVRIQGCFVSDKERDALLDFVKNQRQPEYNLDITSQPIASKNTSSKNIVSVDGEDRDALFDEATKAIAESGQASSSFLQRRLKLGYARAARVIDQLQTAGIIGPSKGAKPRDILIPHNKPQNGNEF